MKRIFVVGCYRSGTTLVQSLLAGHSAITSFTESHFFNKGFYRLGAKRYVVRRHLTDLVNTFLAENGFAPEQVGPFPGRDGLLSTDPYRVATELVQLIDCCAMQRGVSAWVEKTPNHVFRIPLLQKAASSPRFVHVIRRPEGVLPSLHKASREWGRMKTLTESAVHWVWALKVSEAYLGHPSHYFISYERLVQNPMLHTKRLVHWLGLDWEEQILDNYRQEAMHLTTSQEPWKNSNFRTITNKNRFAFPDLPWAARIIVESFNCYERLDRAMETR